MLTAASAWVKWQDDTRNVLQSNNIHNIVIIKKINIKWKKFLVF